MRTLDGRQHFAEELYARNTTYPKPVPIAEVYLSQSRSQHKMEKVMSVTLFPNVLEPATALKSYAPISVKFWENQGTALEGLKEFSDGWFARRHKSTQAALEAAKHIGDAATPHDVFREYQNWLARAMELLAEDGKAYQQQVLRAAVHLTAPLEARQADEQRTG
jgi:Phasin protein